MSSLSFLRSRSSGARVLALVIAQTVLGSGVNAASVNGVANATVIGEITSQPIVIRLQTPGVIVSNFPIRLGFTINRPARSADVVGGGGSSAESAGPGASFGITLVDVDAAGVARFSVAGAGATSGYTVQFPTSADSLLSQSAGTANGGCSADLASNSAQGCGSRDVAASLIVPAQALTGGGRLAVEVSQALSRRFAGELNVQVNYN